jgi:hypothetical protein
VALWDIFWVSVTLGGCVAVFTVLARLVKWLERKGDVV